MLSSLLFLLSDLSIKLLDVRGGGLSDSFCFLSLWRIKIPLARFLIYSSSRRFAINMKSILFVAIFALANCDVDLTSFDVKPLWQIKEWREVHPKDAELMTFASTVTSLPRGSRIFNGEVAGPTDFPYMAGVMLHFDSGNSFCGGSLISVNFVLTAAKCVHIVPSSSVLLGASNMNTVQYMNRVNKVMIHPQFSFDNSLNDIATLELSRRADLSPTIALVRLPNRRQVQTTFENQQSIVTG